MTSRIEYKGNLRTEATHLRSGNKIITDAPVDNEGNGEAFSPTDLAATALGCCMVTIMGIAAKARNIDMEGTVVDVKKIMASEPRRIGRIEITITMPPKAYSEKEKSILEKAAHACPVGLSLHPDLEEVLEIIWS